jgi:HAE1 family hydrophobic/amphiphilic exporter-1
MNLSDLSIRRPVFITAIVIVMVTLGLMAFKKMPVDMFPNVTFPVVMVQTAYPGAGPAEVETLVSKILEEQISTVAGIKTLSSNNTEGNSMVIAEFTLDTDVKYAEQQIRDKVSSALSKLPTDSKQPVIRRIDPADQPIVILAMTSEMPDAELFDLADKTIKPKIEQVSQVGQVQVFGGREREIHVELDRAKLKQYELSATAVSARIAAAGANIPAGSVNKASQELVFRTVGEFGSVKDIGSVIVSFLGNDVPVTVNDVGRVVDTVKDETSRGYYNGHKAVFMIVFRQSGANTIAVADAVKKRAEQINKDFAATNSTAKMIVVRDGAKAIRANVLDVEETIGFGILLTVLVVFFFLGSLRSTLITGLAIPNSLIGAFFLMSVAGFSINIMTLLALSIAVGLLIDDAIVVRENIFRHAEMGKPPIKAASEGTKEVLLAVIATTGAVISVFAPIGFLSGVVGQFFKEFGLTICFAMLISLFDALTMAPMLSAYFAGAHSAGPKWWAASVGKVLKAFDRFQTYLEDTYAAFLRKAINYPILIIGSALAIFIVSIVLAKFIPKTFLPTPDFGEFQVTLDAAPGTSLDAMAEASSKVDALIRSHKETESSVMFVGSFTGEANKATFFINMIDAKKRKNVTTTKLKEMLREEFKPYAEFRPIVKDIDNVGGGQRPFNLNISGTDLKEIEKYSQLAFEKLKNHPALTDVDISNRPGKPEFQVLPDKVRSERLGVAANVLGQELRAQVEGLTPAVFREKGEEYDIRVRLKEDQRNLLEAFQEAYVPNVNGSLVRLRDVSKAVNTTGPATITRQDRGRYIQIAADMAPKGPGMQAVMDDIDKMFATEIKLPPGMRYKFVGQAESFQELIGNMIIAMGLGILFIYLVLASLYESFVTPFTILLVLPLAACGALFALLITQESLNIFSMIGCVMLLGVATKNSILLVDYTKHLMNEGWEMKKAVVEAGRVRLRPILMTTLALIAGMLPLAIGLNEASKQRTAMGVAVIGGLISSTLLTLMVVPAAFSYLERYRAWSLHKVKTVIGNEAVDAEIAADAAAAAAAVKSTELNH